MNCSRDEALKRQMYVFNSLSLCIGANGPRQSNPTFVKTAGIELSWNLFSHLKTRLLRLSRTPMMWHLCWMSFLLYSTPRCMQISWHFCIKSLKSPLLSPVLSDALPRKAEIFFLSFHRRVRCHLWQKVISTTGGLSSADLFRLSDP